MSRPRLPLTRWTHYCAAEGCPAVVSHLLLMCRRHWYMVPKDVRDRVWATWRHDNPEYVVAVAVAIDAVRERERGAVQ